MYNYYKLMDTYTMAINLTKKNLIEKQELNFEQKNKLRNLMQSSSLDYKDLLNTLN